MKLKVTLLAGLTLLLSTTLMGCANSSQADHRNDNDAKSEKKVSSTTKKNKGIAVQKGFSYKNNVLKIGEGLTYKFTDAKLVPNTKDVAIYVDIKNNSNEEKDTYYADYIYPEQDVKGVNEAGLENTELPDTDNPAIQKLKDLIALNSQRIKPKTTVHTVLLVKVHSLEKPLDLQFRDGLGTLFGKKRIDLASLKTIKDNSGDNASYDTADETSGDQSATTTKGFSYSNDVLNLKYDEDQSASFKFTGAAKVPDTESQMIIYYDVTNTSKMAFRDPSLELYTAYDQADATTGVGYKYGARVDTKSDAAEQLQDLIDKGTDEIQPGETIHTGVLISYTDNNKPVIMTFKNDKKRLIGKRTVYTNNLQDAQQ